MEEITAAELEAIKPALMSDGTYHTGLVVMLAHAYRDHAREFVGVMAQLSALGFTPEELWIGLRD